ncbi:hypothetical protein ACOSQ2_018275 [Xanthoceras sorbifolium]
MFTVAVVEAITILKGRLQFTIESGLLPAALEFDSLLAISATNGENVFLSEVGLIIHDVVELLRSNPGSSVIFVPRSIVVSDNQIPDNFFSITERNPSSSSGTYGSSFMPLQALYIPGVCMHIAYCLSAVGI